MSEPLSDAMLRAIRLRADGATQKTVAETVSAEFDISKYKASYLAGTGIRRLHNRMLRGIGTPEEQKLVAHLIDKGLTIPYFLPRVRKRAQNSEKEN